MHSELPEPSSKPAPRDQRTPPRLWPPLAVIGLFWAGSFFMRQFEFQYFVLFFYSMISAGLLLLLFFGWWWTRRSISLIDRALGFFTVLITGAAFFPLCDKTVGVFGLLFTGLPVVLTAWTLWMLAARTFSLSNNRLGTLVVIVLAWVPFTLQPALKAFRATCAPIFIGAGPRPRRTFSKPSKPLTRRCTRLPPTRPGRPPPPRRIGWSFAARHAMACSAGSRSPQTGATNHLA